MRIRLAWLVAMSLWGGAVDPARGAEAEVDFTRDVRPILSDNCFFCHGPDKQESGLRLDEADVAYQKGAIVPRDPAASEMIRRITSSDPGERMPPPHSNRELEPLEIETLRRWVEKGGVYQKHWAFQPVPGVDLPEVSDTDRWARNPIDLFVLRRLKQKELTGRPPAERERLLRRVTLDLAGLPPSIAEVDAFVADPSTDAYEKVVQRLLASPGFGEQMTQSWVDVARYADTFGYDNDNENHLWPWRDWVVRAFNQNLPYSDFVRWQLAGDLLPEPTQEQMLATAFNRLHRQNAEGGVLPEEFLIEYIVDRTQTFGTAFLGLTIECSRCHDHKFDPVSQRDFYRLYALFGNIDEAGTYAEKTTATPTPSTVLYVDGQREKHTALRQQILHAEEALAECSSGARERFERWRSVARAQDITPPDPVAQMSFESRDKLPESARLVRGRFGQAARFSGDEGVELKDVGVWDRTSTFTIATWLRPTELGSRMVLCHNSKPVWEVGRRGLELALDAAGRVQFSLCHFWPGNALRVRTGQPLPVDTWTHVAVTYDGSSRAEGLRVYFNGAPARLHAVRDHLYSKARLHRKEMPPFVIGAGMSQLGFRQGEVDEFLLFDHCLSQLEVKRVVDREADSFSDLTLFDHYLQRVDESCAMVRQELTEARNTEGEFEQGLRSIMVMREKSTAATAHVLVRGAYDQPGEEVAPGVPASILDPGSSSPRNRMELVEWMLRRDHPLVSRVAVNRIWRVFFGRGLVETVEDFGNQGARPTHPELLDDLAARFMEGGWDVKSLCYLIVTSATYRQSSSASAALIERDPENLLLARGPRYRLSAEEIRDAALAASGLLVRTMGGPSVKPPQPPGLWRAVGAKVFVADQGENLYRRSLYTFWKRTVPPPAMMTFDAVSREVCVARRESTVTPAQALVLLNDPQFVEAARALAVEVLSSCSDPSGAIEMVFRRLTSRKPEEGEKKELLRALAEQRQVFAAAPVAVEEYLAVGAWRQEKSLDRVEVASLAAVVQVVMGFFEFQMK